MNKEMVVPISIFCKIVDITLDCDGNIHLVLSKDRKETAEKTVRILKQFLGQDSTVIFSTFERSR
jgi:hypothetical protein